MLRGASDPAVDLPLVLVEVGESAEHPAAHRTDRAALVQSAVVTQRVAALERLVADLTAEPGHDATCRAQQQRVRIAAI